MDENGCGWFYRHVHNVITFVRHHPDKVMKAAQSNCEKLQKGFDREWRKKVLQFQIPLFAPTTKGAWVLRFDDILADALESGPLREQDASFFPKEMQRIEAVTPKGISIKVIATLISYYRANKPEDSDWVVLPVTNFDAYFGNTSFSRKWLSRIPPALLRRQKQSFGVCRYMVGNLDIDK